MAEAQIKKLDQDAKHVTKQTADLHDLVKKRSHRFAESLKKSTETEATIEIKLKTKLVGAERGLARRLLHRGEGTPFSNKRMRS